MTTVVLVHGAFADSASWNGVIERLLADGTTVVAPPNHLRGLSNDAAYLKSFVKSIEGPVLLVGHSYGGAVISAAAAELPQVVGLVYIAAFVPEKGRASGVSARAFRRRRSARPSARRRTRCPTGPTRLRCTWTTRLIRRSSRQICPRR